MQLAIPVIAILQDHLDVPSIVICSACSIESMCVSGSTENVVLRGRTNTPETRITTPNTKQHHLITKQRRAIQN